LSYTYPPSMEKLIFYLAKLPGVGPKTAQRLAFHLLRAGEDEVFGLSMAIAEAKQKVRRCRICANLTDDEICPVCADRGRDGTLLCVVEQPADAMSIEKTGEFHGVYHVLHGALSPLDGVGPAELTIPLLMSRLKNGMVREVVLATNNGTEGEATALYLARLIKPLGLKVSRLAHGIPVGGDLEYLDELTLSRAFTGRQTL